MPVDKSAGGFRTIKIFETTDEPSYRSDEDVAICKAFVSVLEDLRNGNLKLQSDLCNGIFQKFVANRKNQEKRSQDSVQQRWEKIMARCFKYHSYLTQIRYESPKGVTESDMAHKAKLLYLEYERQQFVMDHCWEILQHKIQWHGNTKRQNTPTRTTDSSPRSSRVAQILSVTIPSQDFNQITCRGLCQCSPNGERPGRREAEKERRHGKAEAAELETSHIDDLIDQLTKHNMKAEMRKDHLEEKRLQLLKKAQERKEKQVLAKEIEADDVVMLMDTSKMDHQTKVYWALRKDEIIAKVFNRLNIAG
ncbi:hypothetical protein Vadar_028522 [Vaccinium darrowii]|uniref:Uncharacterized protein n=1 Tax=Vaccinium darrowii TaxID=229202 RepID=A0ACB7Y2E2_9ERIC|nr:hypothetical protein Vadar_028522 [Vaccinium darrowii]